MNEASLPKRDELHLILYSVADLRRPEAFARIGRAFDADPRLRFEKLGTSEGRKTPVVSVEAALVQWRPPPKRADMGATFFLGRRAGPRGNGTIDISRMDPLRGTYEHVVDASYDLSWFGDHTERWEAFAGLFGRLADAMSAFYGNAHRLFFYVQHRLLMDRARGLWGPGWRLDREIPDVYWLNFFGGAYVERFASRLHRLGVRQVPAAGGLVIWATERPVPIRDVASMTDYEYKQPFYAALGKNTFYHEAHTPNEPGARVPTYAEHQKHVATA